MDVNRQTTVLEIKNVAAKQCQLRQECFDIFANELLLADFDSVESSNFFVSDKALRISSQPNCGA